MNSGTEPDSPRPARVDYPEMARQYNREDIGRVISVPKLTNLANLKKALKLRGLEEGVDYEAHQRGSLCYVRRLSKKPMNIR